MSLLPLLVHLSLPAWSAPESPDELAEAEAEADRLDPGWRFDDLLANRRQQRPTDDRNGALQAERIFKKLPQDWLKPAPGDAERPFDPEERPRGYRLQDALGRFKPNERLPDLVAEGLRAELDAIPEAVGAARKLVDFPEGQASFELQLNPIEIQLPYAQNSRSVARLLQLDAYRRAHEGDLDGALESIRALLNLARTLRDEPFLVSQLVRMAIDDIAVATLQRVLAQGQPSPEALERLQAAILEEADDNRIVVGLRGERATFYDLAGKMASGELGPEELGGGKGDDLDDTLAKLVKILPRILRGAFFRHNQAVGLHLMNEAVEIAKKPHERQPEEWAKWNERLAGLRQGGPASTVSNSLVLLMLPAIEAVAKADARVTCNLRAAATALAAERWRQRHGHWPESLEAVVPETLDATPIDTYTGKPVLIRSFDNRLLIYGTGEDRQNDGGQFDSRGRPAPGFDVGFQLFDADHRAVEAAAAVEPDP